MNLSRNEKAVVFGVSVVGVGVAVSAVLTEYLERSKTSSEPKEQEYFYLKSIASKEELMKVCADGYAVYKQPLSKIMKFVGQMFVAPIALKALDAVYNAYCDNASSCLALEQPSLSKVD
ncbi:unnamed protein product [Agarophyton chilense]